MAHMALLAWYRHRGVPLAAGARVLRQDSCRSHAAARPLPTLCSIDLGKFGSAEEAARAHDRAALLAGGLQSTTNFALPDVFAAGIAACTPAVAAPGQQYRGVVNRSGNWLALLDVGEGARTLQVGGEGARTR